MSIWHNAMLRVSRSCKYIKFCIDTRLALYERTSYSYRGEVTTHLLYNLNSLEDKKSFFDYYSLIKEQQIPNPMVPIRSHIVRSSDYLCLSCLRCQNPSSASLYNSLGQRRFITQKYLAKTAQAADWWCEQAGQIRAGKKQSILSTLEQRGYVNSVVG